MPGLDKYYHRFGQRLGGACLGQGDVVAPRQWTYLIITCSSSAIKMVIQAYTNRIELVVHYDVIPGCCASGALY